MEKVLPKARPHFCSSRWVRKLCGEPAENLLGGGRLLEGGVPIKTGFCPKKPPLASSMGFPHLKRMCNRPARSSRRRFIQSACLSASALMCLSASPKHQRWRVTFSGPSREPSSRVKPAFGARPFWNNRSTSRKLLTVGGRTVSSSRPPRNRSKADLWICCWACRLKFPRRIEQQSSRFRFWGKESA